MSLVSVLYIFDKDDFENKISSYLKALPAGHHDALRQLANELAKKNPNVWSLLNDLSYFPSDLGSEEESFSELNDSITFWITLVIFTCCSRLRDFENASEISNLKISDAIEHRLIVGKPISDLLYDATDFEAKRPIELFNSLRFRVGWLSAQDIENKILEVDHALQKSNSPTSKNLLKLLKEIARSGKGVILGSTL